MPRFNVFQPFKASHRNRNEQAAHDDRLSRYGAYEQSRAPVATTRSGSRWRNVLTKRRELRDDSYIDDPEYDVTSEPEVRRMPVAYPSRRPTVEDYDSMTTDSNDYPARYPMSEREPGTRFVERIASHESLPREPSDHYVQRVPSHESIPVEGHTPQPTVIQTPSEVPPLASPPGEVYMEEPVPLPLTQDERSAHEHEPPAIQAEPRRFRARRGEPITVGNMRIEVEDDGRHSRSHRSRRSASASTASHSSLSSQSYSSSSYDERPIIIAADPHTQIEIGNEEDGFVPYEQYLAEREARRRRRRRHHRDTPEEEIYVIPAGTNVIFVDEDGRELHRVGEFDDRYSSRRRNTSARTTRQILPSYQEVNLEERIAGHTYAEQGVQTESNEIHVHRRPVPDVGFSPAPSDSQLISQMHERMRNFMNSRPPSRSSSPLRREVGLTERTQSASLVPLHDQASLPLPFPGILQFKVAYDQSRRMGM